RLDDYRVGIGRRIYANRFGAEAWNDAQQKLHEAADRLESNDRYGNLEGRTLPDGIFVQCIAPDCALFLEGRDLAAERIADGLRGHYRSPVRCCLLPRSIRSQIDDEGSCANCAKIEYLDVK